MSEYDTLVLTSTGNQDEYRAYIPSPLENKNITYTIQAADSSGRVETLPMAGYFVFTVLALLAGDVTLDGQVNILDIVAVVNDILGDQDLTPEQIQIADLNHDGLVDVFDIVRIVNIILSIP